MDGEATVLDVEPQGLAEAVLKATLRGSRGVWHGARGASMSHSLPPHKRTALLTGELVLLAGKSELRGIGSLLPPAAGFQADTLVSI